jgi:AraC family transcriptional regulator of adaptative response/methylated-DNA-[protein]-cysteine methyltransferase
MEERTMLDHEACWAAVAARDAGADGRFFYAVTTTGVYCRPGCASRLPRRENVRFFADTAAAEAAGFRPCKRCRPTEDSAAARHLAAIGKACALLRDGEPMPSLDQLAAAAGMSRYHFHRVFKQVTGATPRDYARAQRIGRFADALAAGGSVTAAVYAAGFGSSSRAYEDAPQGLGMTPGKQRHGGNGETIRFVTVETPLGHALVAATARGICMTALADDPASLVAQLRARFPAAVLVAEDAELRSWAERIVRFITQPQESLDLLPLDIRGTAFQARVWRALRKIPPGRTASYAEIATAIGAPKAVRAVAQACAANRLALVVPCHRVIRSDGGLGGYRWGVDKKRALLARERAALSGQAVDAAAE